MNRIVVAYSGSFESAVAIRWLALEHGAEIVTMTVDLGDHADLVAVRERALALGATRAHVIDAREEFSRDYVLPALQAGAFLEERLALVSTVGSALLARRLMDVAAMESAAAVAHGGRPGTAAESTLHALIRDLAKTTDVLPFERTWEERHLDIADFAARHGFPAPAAARPRVHVNICGRVVHPGAGDGEAPARVLTRPHAEAPEQPAVLELQFEHGVPVSVNGIEMPLTEMMESIETIAGAHGVGRTDASAPWSEQGVVEAPAVVVLQTAHTVLQAEALGPDLAAMTRGLADPYGAAIAEGRWFSDGREGLAAFIRLLQARVTGRVRLRLWKGTCDVIECRPQRPTASDSKAVA